MAAHGCQGKQVGESASWGGGLVGYVGREGRGLLGV